ncbi:CHAD domain-containing protein [Aurantimonas sp. Leaf443]|uniref:CHAD domain-containing protein n=1 Tax=Aurantimonas sp. Leaf443 TaxID=1736378 RepID=UPI0006FEA7C7|nr:CHAD domain-containing protein [Aurantimonas sp. Leaf443]KQT87528.1 hypothetical protein ASG48_17200 [Aurantimonas sp. Leaf443]
MAFTLQPGQPLDAQLRRLGLRQIERAGAALADPVTDAGIHDARKRLKKLRGLLRLVRAGDEAFYRAENERLRDAARRLSALRDRAALRQSLDTVPVPADQPGLDRALKAVRGALDRRAKEAGVADAQDALAAVRRDLAEARARLEAFVLPKKKAGPKGAGRLVADGFADNLAAARRALAKAGKSGRAEDFHDLRKRVKYHAQHLKLLSPLHPAPFRALQDEADALGEDLGTDHDHAVLIAAMASAPDEFGPGHPAVAALLAGRQDILRKTGLLAARRLFAEKPRAAAKRLRGLYAVAALNPEPGPDTAAPDGPDDD